MPNSTEFVLTPHGPFPSANVHEIPAGGTVRQVGDEIHLLDASGNTVHVASHRSAPNEPPMGKLNIDDQPRAVLAYAQYATWKDKTHPSTIAKSVASWRVPPTPSFAPESPAQTLFWFISAVTWDGLNAIKPTLQYGPSAAGGGPYWSIALWHLMSDDRAYYTPVKRVFSGTELTAVFASVPDTNRSVASIFSHTPGPTYTAEFDQTFRSISVGMGRGDYAESDPLSFPPTPTAFGPITVGVNVNGPGAPPPDLRWEVAPMDKQYGLGLVVDKTSVDDSQITISYNNPTQ